VGSARAFSGAGKRKLYSLDSALQKGVLLLDGHITRKLSEAELGSFIMCGHPRMYAPDGVEELVAFLVENCVEHTMDRLRCSLSAVSGEEKTESRHESDLLPSLLAALPPAFEIEQAEPAKVIHHQILNDGDVTKLKAAAEDSTKPIIKLFNPAGCETWLLCHLEVGGDIAWGYADIGHGLVEFGTISLVELGSVKLPYGPAH
jgi:hypothetical protein